MTCAVMVDDPQVPDIDSDDALPPLMPKQKAFVLAYLSNNFNATQAAIAAGYSEDTARQQGSRLLTYANVRREIDSFFEQNTMKAQEALLLLTQHARGDVGDLWDEATGQIDWKKARAAKKTRLIKRMYHKTTRITRGEGKNLEEIETFEDTIELHDPQKAITLIGKQLGLFIERSETKITGELAVKSYKGYSPDEWDDDGDSSTDA